MLAYTYSLHLFELKVEWIEKRLQRKPILNLTDLPPLITNIDSYFGFVNMPEDCKINPDQYLKKGDHVRVKYFKFKFFNQTGRLLGE